MTFVNPLRQRWQAGGAVRGAWALTPDALVAEALAGAGADFVCLDLQHGAIGYADAVPMIAAVAGQGSAPLVRVPSNEPWLIGKVLDAGALGVIVPLVNSADDAAAAVAACRYPPRGTRSFGPVRAAGVVGSADPADLGEVVVAVMVETRQGLDDVEAIAATEGVDAIYVGPADLSLALDLPLAFEHAEGEHPEALRRVRAACAAAGAVAGVHCTDGDMGARRLSQGFRMVSVATDLDLVRDGARTALGRVDRGAGAVP